ncbi:intradiol ring-cleavage dioxygenase [Rhodobacter sp. SGA-6-6]|uniref:intradiol ring-cleavage dioxygenase n=1 Tax=Rhodobacter sp. SGA-6-6 TaxID=2710882 RepID=UPI0013E9F106|nr:intradiol ring-cleavage dioxygenase [Rhodobacter sp. SGA-6-6]NGM47340.1 intradiol ring-cleavage dioxygenase [Rhodobacter sp. SGA-6-6]
MPRPLTVLDRRSLLKALSLAPALAVAVPARARAEAQEAGLIAPEVCLLQPEVTEGPYYLEEDLIRQDIAEGRPGLPLVLRLQVVTADCRPVPAARVDVWHCDAAGAYSGVEGAGGTFLRGTQETGAEGVAEFRTIFPGWYRGRVTHVHYKVFLDARTVLTGQVFFDDALAETIHSEHPAYEARGPQDTPLGRDGIARQAGAGAVARVEMDAPDGEAVAALVIGIDADRPAGGLLERLFGQG